MTEETIERVFSPRDWNDSVCDVCCKYTGVVLLSDQRVCYDCLLTNFAEAGDPIITEKELEAGFNYPEPSGIIAKNTIQSFLLGFCAAIGFVLVALGPFLMTADEVGQFWAGGLTR